MARSAGRTVHFGRYFVDLTAALDLGMPAKVYQGYDAQSDFFVERIFCIEIVLSRCQRTFLHIRCR